jgi:hypothetical protein
MRVEPSLERSSAHRAVVRVILQGPDGVSEREVASADFEPSERGLGMGPVLVPWARVFRYDLVVRQAFVPDAEEGGSRAVQRVIYEDEEGLQRRIEVPFDRFESGPWSVTMVAEREVDAERRELVIRRISIPWHRVIETERIFSVPDVNPARPDR